MKIELHAHTDESSGCGKMPAEELLGRFKGAGYDTIVITDHFIGKAARTRIRPWTWRAAA